LGGVRFGVLVCPSSPDHADESVLASRSYELLHNLADELSMGIHFRWDFEIEYNEMIHAAAAFAGAGPNEPEWGEAFETDPHTPRERLYPGGFRVSLKAQRLDWQVSEVEQERDDVEALTAIYETVRQSGRTFDEQAEMEFADVVKWKLGPIVASNWFRAKMAEWTLGAVKALESPDNVTAPGSLFNMYSAGQKTAGFCNYLVRRFPLLTARASEFATSEELRACPSLALPALMFAGIAATPRRKAKPGDRYDRSHLMKGLSRCDIVTADSGMVQICRERKLVPAGVSLYSSAEHSALHEHLERLLTAYGSL